LHNSKEGNHVHIFKDHNTHYPEEPFFHNLPGDMRLTSMVLRPEEHLADNDQVQQPGRLRRHQAPERRDAGPVCCNRWFGGGLWFGPLVLDQQSAFLLLELGRPALLIPNAER
jgi:hypothetical protein